MNVLHINCNYMSTALHQTMIEHLNKQGINSKIFAPIYDEKRNVIQPNENVIVSKCFKKADRYNFYYKQSKIRKSLEKSISVADYDCIHAYTLFTDGNTAYELSKKYHKPFVVAIRDTDVNDFFPKRIFLRKRGIEILENASAVFFLSEAYRRKVLEKYVPKEIKECIQKKSYIIPNGIDDFWFENLYKERDNSQRICNMANLRLNVAYVGAISKRKNVSTTVKALKILQQKGWNIKLNVAGSKQSDKEFNVMQSFAGTNYLGKLNKEEIINCYRENDIFIMPSKTETFGLVYAEAMSQGLPVIYTKDQGFDGQFEEGVVGHAVCATDEMQIVEAIIKIVSNYQEISNNCYTYVNCFKWDTICEKYLNIYKSIVERNA